MYKSQTVLSDVQESLLYCPVQDLECTVRCTREPGCVCRRTGEAVCAGVHGRGLQLLHGEGQQGHRRNQMLPRQAAHLYQRGMQGTRNMWPLNWVDWQKCILPSVLMTGVKINRLVHVNPRSNEVCEFDDYMTGRMAHARQTRTDRELHTNALT